MPPPKTTTHTTTQELTLIPTLGVTLWLGWNGMLTYGILYAAFLASTLQRNIIISILTLSVILPPEFPKGYGTKMGSWLMQQARRYFGLKYTIEDEEALHKFNEQKKPVIFAVEPHDILPYGVFAFNPSLKVLPGRIGETMRVLMTTAVFNLPIMKHVYSWVGGSPVDKKTFRGMLERGESLAFVPGGVQEVIMMDPLKPNELVLFLKNRKGFIKLALERGVPIVPTFIFNLDGSFNSLIPRGKLATAIARKIGFLPVFFWGRFGIPFGIPNPQKIEVVFGKPIEVPCHGDNIKSEAVEEYHKLYLEKVVEVFERNKDGAGYGKYTLKIM